MNKLNSNEENILKTLQEHEIIKLISLKKDIEGTNINEGYRRELTKKIDELIVTELKITTHKLSQIISYYDYKDN